MNLPIKKGTIPLGREAWAGAVGVTFSLGLTCFLGYYEGRGLSSSSSDSSG